MALELKISKDTLNTTTRVFKVDDTTGNYNVSTNPTGYGTPNPARADIRLICYAQLKTTSEDVALAVTPNNADEAVASSWNIQTTADGWHKVYLFGLEPLGDEQDGAGVHTIGEYQYENGQGVYEVTAYEGGQWVFTQVATEAQAGEFLLENIENVPYVAELNELVLIDTLKCKQRANFEYLEQNCNCRDNVNNVAVRKAMEKYLDIRSNIEGALDHFANQNYTKSQELVEHLSNLCECYQA